MSPFRSRLLLLPRLPWKATMAEAGAPDLFSEQELTCSICLDLFDEPVSTPCGHNFCQVRLAAPR